MKQYARDSIGVHTARLCQTQLMRLMQFLFEKPMEKYPFLSIVVTIATAGIPLGILLVLVILMLAFLLLEGVAFQITKEIRSIRGLEVEEWERDEFMW